MKIRKDSRLYLKILSALAAIVLWFAITYTEDPIISQYLNDINVIFEGEDSLHANGLIVTNKSSIPALSVTIRGNRSSVISSIGSISASVDVSGITEAGTNNVEIKYNYPSSYVTLAKTRTKEIALETEKIVSRNIPIKVETENDDKNTEYIIKATTEDSTVKVQGAENTVYEISYAKAVVDVTNVTRTSSQEYFYKFYNDENEIISDSNIIYKSIETISIDNTVYAKKALPVKVVLPEDMAEDYVLSVKGASMTTVEAGVPANSSVTELYAYFDEAKLKENGKYELSITVPEGCYVPKKNLVITASCELTPKVLKELEIPVTVQNVPEGKKITLAPEKIKITAKGAENVLMTDKIKATVNAAKIPDDGEGAVSVLITTEEDIKIIGAYSVIAKIE